jgi:hypothetical protein
VREYRVSWRELLNSAWLVATMATLGAEAQTPRVAVPSSTPLVAQGTTFAPPPATYVPPGGFTSPPTTYAPPAATFTTPAPATSPFTTPVPGSFGSSVPPPTFDPYASGGYGTVAPAPFSVAPQPVVPSQPAPMFPDGMAVPFDWQQGSYSFQGTNGVAFQAQRLFQDVGVEHTWVYGERGDPRDFEINRSEIYTTMAFPSPYLLNAPLLVTPGFAVNFLEGPVGDPTAVPRGPDLPPRIYDAYLDFAWFPQFTPQLGAELGFRTGVWTDFDHVDSDSVRFLGRGLAKLSVTPQFDILIGAVYLDRVDVKWLPAGGIYWRPTPEWDVYAVFPNPKVRKRFSTFGTTDWYWYFAGEYGGGSWSVDRVGTSDRIDINDIRVSFGFEWETQTQIRGHIEAGYVFDREIIFAETAMPPVFEPEDTFMIRGGVDF